MCLETPNLICKLLKDLQRFICKSLIQLVFYNVKAVFLTFRHRYANGQKLAVRNIYLLLGFSHYMYSPYGTDWKGDKFGCTKH